MLVWGRRTAATHRSGCGHRDCTKQWHCRKCEQRAAPATSWRDRPTRTTPGANGRDLVGSGRQDVPRDLGAIRLQRPGDRCQINRKGGADLADRTQQISDRLIIGVMIPSAHHAPSFATVVSVPSGRSFPRSGFVTPAAQVQTSDWDHWDHWCAERVLCQPTEARACDNRPHRRDRRPDAGVSRWDRGPGARPGATVRRLPATGWCWGHARQSARQRWRRSLGRR